MGILGGLERGIKAAIGVVIVAIGIFSCGAVAAFVLSPQAALEWRHIDSLPILDATAYANLKADDEAVITGSMQDNQVLTSDGLVAYEKDRWTVKPPATSESGTPSSPSGSWDTLETKMPTLAIAITGGVVHTIPVTSVTFGGQQHTTIQPGTGSLSADDDGRSLPDGSIRYQGYANGDLVTLVGRKGSTGDLIPNRLFGGDRVQLVDSIRSEAQGLFTTGIGLMICSPIFLVIGLVAVLLGRRRGLLG